MHFNTESSFEQFVLWAEFNAVNWYSVLTLLSFCRAMLGHYAAMQCLSVRVRHVRELCQNE